MTDDEYLKRLIYGKEWAEGKWDFNPWTHSQPLDSETQEQIRLLYPKMRTADMAKRLGLCTRTVQRYAKKAGIMKPPGWNQHGR